MDWNELMRGARASEVARPEIPKLGNSIVRSVTGRKYLRYLRTTGMVILAMGVIYSIPVVRHAAEVMQRLESMDEHNPRLTERHARGKILVEGAEENRLHPYYWGKIIASETYLNIVQN